jgi:hypothetical protein
LILLALVVLAGSLPSVAVQIWPALARQLPAWSITVAPAVAAIAALALVALFYRARWGANG